MILDRELIVDDDLGLREQIAEFLTLEGFRVDAVHDETRGLERSLSGDDAVVILDVRL